MQKRLIIILIVIFAAGGIIWILRAGRPSPNQNQAGQSLPQQAPETKLAPYANPYFLVSFSYPAAWQPDAHYPKIQDIPTHFSGTDGFFSVDTIGGKDAPLQEVVQTLISNPAMLYGKTPISTAAKLGDQDAVFVIPSADQAPENRGGAAFIVRYPKPISFNKKTIYYYLILFADKNHIQSIAETMNFLPEK